MQYFLARFVTPSYIYQMSLSNHRTTFDISSLSFSSSDCQAGSMGVSPLKRAFLPHKSKLRCLKAVQGHIPCQGGPETALISAGCGLCLLHANASSKIFDPKAPIPMALARATLLTTITFIFSHAGETPLVPLTVSGEVTGVERPHLYYMKQKGGSEAWKYRRQFAIRLES